MERLEGHRRSGGSTVSHESSAGCGQSGVPVSHGVPTPYIATPRISISMKSVN